MATDSCYTVFVINNRGCVVTRRTLEAPGRLPRREWVLTEVDEHNNGRWNGATFSLNGPAELARTRAGEEAELHALNTPWARKVGL